MEAWVLTRLQTVDGRHFRIRAFVHSDDMEPDSPAMGLWEVEPA